MLRDREMSKWCASNCACETLQQPESGWHTMMLTNTDQPAVRTPRRISARPDGVVRLDGWLGFQGGACSATNPSEIIEGNVFRDSEQIRQMLAQHSRPDASGGLLGWAGFNGNFRFGVFSHFRSEPLIPAQVHDHGEEIQFEPQMSRTEYIRIVRRAQEYIAAGDIYQANLSYPWLAEWPQNLEPLAFYERLRAASPAPHSAYLDLGGTQVFSASPECFLKMSGNQILTRPIKGTRPRGSDAQEDRDLVAELQQSAKERAELVMITDLERNDLGQVCEFGSVHVTEMLGLESHPQVHHLVSTVEGMLRRDIGHLDAFLACFPGGSISGAPKKRALEIIRELEPHDRGLYTGAIGYFGFNGESQFSIAIRTAWRTGNVVQFHTGAGIVADSVPELEYEETRHKAAGILRAARGW
ncbi:MAG: anthranilate synthase component I family protein [Verrucomicrobia bacterium]|nr:anthranilate synthase component I family protein [Verrucomicrobiota bacterium]